MMSHTAPVNFGLFFGINGRVYTTSSACTSASQGIGFAYEAIKHGYQKLMVAGGADELSACQAAVFDTLYATSLQNDNPQSTPRPFDIDRDGLVIGEGAGALILEEFDHAKNRGAKIYAEIVGFGTNSDGLHVTQPDSLSMQVPMQLALKDANLAAEQIAYISAHGTATEHGDIAESHATYSIFGNKTPISSLKSYTGHTLGACGALEAWTAILMMNESWFHPNLNLVNPDPRCAALDYIVGDIRQINCEYIMSNNFAFGGINTSLIFKRI
jgi:3-oxoacyl-[acyl-carrier-protein] synthase II